MRIVKGVVGLTVAAALFAQLSHAEVNVIGRGTYRPSRQSQNLVVNTDNSFRYICKRSESSGIQDIVKLITTNKYEEEWIYLPKEQTWYEIGVQERSVQGREGFIQGSVISDPTGLEKVLDKQPLIKFYHFHPVDMDVLHRQVAGMSKGLPVREQDRPALEEKLVYLLAAITGVPSSSDIRKMSRVYLKNKGGDRLSYNSVSMFGVFEYSLSQYGLKTHTSIESPAIKQELIDYNVRIASLTAEGNIDLAGWLKAEDYRPFMHQIAAHLSSKSITVRYRDFDSFK
jgi:hypothetical protein